MHRSLQSDPRTSVEPLPPGWGLSHWRNRSVSPCWAAKGTSGNSCTTERLYPVGLLLPKRTVAMIHRRRSSDFPEGRSFLRMKSRDSPEAWEPAAEVCTSGTKSCEKSGIPCNRDSSGQCSHSCWTPSYGRWNQSTNKRRSFSRTSRSMEGGSRRFFQ